MPYRNALPNRQIAAHSLLTFFVLTPGPPRHSLHATSLHDRALPAAGWFLRLRCPLDLGNHLLEGFGNVLVLSRRCLDKTAFEFRCYLLALFDGDFSLGFLEVTLVSDDHDWDRVGSLRNVSNEKSFRSGETYQVIQNLVMDDIDHIEGLLRGDRVYEHIPMDADEVLRIEHAVLILRVWLVLVVYPRAVSTDLALCINDLCQKGLAFVLDLMAECVLDGWVVGFDKVAFDVSDSEGGFT